MDQGFGPLGNAGICGFPKMGYLFGGPYKKDSSIFGSILGPLVLGHYHIAWVLVRLGFNV